MLCLGDSYIFIFKNACEMLLYFPIVPKQLDHKLKLDNKDSKDNKHNNKSYYNSIKGNKLSFSRALRSTYERRTKSQVYTLMLGSRNIPVYCFMGDFGCGSGGWTLVMKTDGTKVKEGKFGGQLLFTFQKMVSFYFFVNFSERNSARVAFFGVCFSPVENSDLNQDDLI